MRGHMRRAEAGMDRTEDLRQQAVARHGHEDPRLAQEKHQKHARHAGQAAGGDQARARTSARACPAPGGGSKADGDRGIDVDLWIRDHARHHRRNYDVQQRAQGQ